MHLLQLAKLGNVVLLLGNPAIRAFLWDMKDLRPNHSSACRDMHAHPLWKAPLPQAMWEIRFNHFCWSRSAACRVVKHSCWGRKEKEQPMGGWGQAEVLLSAPHKVTILSSTWRFLSMLWHWVIIDVGISRESLERGAGCAADKWVETGRKKSLQPLQALYFCPNWVASPFQDLYRG